MKLPTTGNEHIYRADGWSHPVITGNNNCYAYALHDRKLFRYQKSVPGARSGMKAPNSFRYTTCGNLAKRVLSDNPRKVKMGKENKKCPSGYYKIMMFVAPENNSGSGYGDFHFYKQHSNVEYKIRYGDTPKSLAEFFGKGVATLRQAARRAFILRNPRKKTPTIAEYWKPGLKIKFKANVWSHKQGWATGALLKDACGKSIKNPRKACRNYGMNYKTYCDSFCVKKGSKPRVGKRNTNVRKNSR